MNEPSVLDYLKYKLGMIKNLDFGDEEISQPEKDSSAQTKSSLKPEDAQNEGISDATEEDSSFILHRSPFPWRSLLTLTLALIAQWTFEPPRTSSPSTGIILYLASFVTLILAYKNDEWHLPSLRKSAKQIDDFAINIPKIISIVVGASFAIIAFFIFDENEFTFQNTSLWLVSIFLLVSGLWNNKEKPEKRNGEKISFAPISGEARRGFQWGLLLLAISAILLFFRLYQTGSIPAEPFSDHAEKILDVYDITQGDTRIFFPRNTGREALQMYWTLFISKIFNTGLSFLSLKLGTALLGLFTLPYVYLLGKEIANRRVGAIAAFLMGISYWHNVISRVGLRFPLYPLFVAPVLFYLLRGIRRQSRNDFILAGLFLGLGMHGYSPFRIMPFVVLAAIGIYFLHKQSRGIRKQVFTQFVILVLISLILFLPLGRYALANPEGFSYRAFSRLDNNAGDSLSIFASNFMDGLKMFNWDNGGIWVHSVAGRPALGVVSASFFLLGILLLLLRYAKKRHWLDLFLLLSIPLLTLPSTLSIAFPEENPALNRAGGAAVVVFVVAALAVDGLLASLRSRAERKRILWAVSALLILASLSQNYNLVFNVYAENFRLGAWNSSEMGKVIQEFEEQNGQTDTVWIVPYAHWVDTRLPGVWAGIPNRDFALWQDHLAESLTAPSPKLFMLRIEDTISLAELQRLYPNGTASRYTSATPNHDFMIFSVP